MGALLALFLIATVSLVLVRVGTAALMMTGIDRDTASFQSYSAFFGVGFTTSEAELVVNHPVRRRIIRDLILAGNIGLTSALATLVVTFVQTTTTTQVLQMVGLIAIGGFLIYILTRIGLLNRALDHAIRVSLERAGVVHALDYELLLRVRAGYAISEMEIESDCRLAGLTLRQSRPADMGIIVLGINKADGSFKGAPGPEDLIEVGDVTVMYGRDKDVEQIRARQHT
ncbi:MAG: TrkA C-terminal domain-containing protein [Verrucomicrobiae bacterium]|nr:TrkA C-terminal domain-containing protein [Verrucomicrobiae bacterium]